MAKTESLLKKVEKLEKKIKRLERRQEILEDSIPTPDDIKALLEAEKDLKSKKLVPLPEIERELQ